MANKVSRETIESSISGVLNVADRVSIDAGSINELTTKKGNVAVQKKYDFAVKVGSRVGVTISDSALIESIEKIRVAERAKTVMGYVICKEMANIADSGKLESMGFKNIAEFGRAMFNYKTSTSNHYARIGRNFITDDYHVKEGLPELSISHFIELNAQVGEDGDISDIVEMYLDGTLVDGMSTKDLRNALNSAKNQIEGRIAGESDESNESDESVKSNESDKSGKGNKAEKSINSNKSNDDESDPNVILGKALNALATFSECMITLNSNGIAIDSNFVNSHINPLAELVRSLVK